VGLRLSEEQVIAFIQDCAGPYTEASERAGVSAENASRYLCKIAMLFGIRGGPLPGD